MQKISVWYCNFTKNPYLCIVFFIVLDLRLTKIGTQRSPFFYAHKSDTSKNKDYPQSVIRTFTLFFHDFLQSFTFNASTTNLSDSKTAVIKYSK